MAGSASWFEELLAVADIRVGGDRPWDLQIHDPSVADRLAAQGSLGFGDAYVEGLWDCQALDVLFDKALRARLETRVRPSVSLAASAIRGLVHNPQGRKLSRRVAERHYDLGNDFYEAMLDPWMQYTCAWYGSGAVTLEEAQEAKLDLVCRKLGLAPGMRVLELGCGWGGFARFAASRHGVHVRGYNISREQVEWARKRCAGLDVDLHLQDYRDADGTWDRVVSVGMCEHVGPRNLRRFLELVHDGLADGGVFLLHTIGGNRSVQDNDAWVDRHIFPGAVLPSVAQIARAAEGLFVVEDLHNIGADYDTTLMAWNERFEAAWPRFSESMGEPFRRMWRYYLLMCAGSFRSRKNQLFQVVLSKGGLAPGWRCPR